LPFLVAEIQEMVVGYARVDDDPNLGFVISIAIDPNYHSKGIGSSLLMRLEDDCFSRAKMRLLYASINKDNVASRDFFEKNGYSLCGADQKDFDLFRKGAEQELTN